jgi:hypothetical protein
LRCDFFQSASLRRISSGEYPTGCATPTRYPPQPREPHPHSRSAADKRWSVHCFLEGAGGVPGGIGVAGNAT